MAAKEYLQYSTMMLYHNIINSEEKHVVKDQQTILSKPFTVKSV